MIEYNSTVNTAVQRVNFPPDHPRRPAHHRSHETQAEQPNATRFSQRSTITPYSTGRHYRRLPHDTPRPPANTARKCRKCGGNLHSMCDVLDPASDAKFHGVCNARCSSCLCHVLIVTAMQQYFLSLSTAEGGENETVPS